MVFEKVYEKLQAIVNSLIEHDPSLVNELSCTIIADKNDDNIRSWLEHVLHLVENYNWPKELDNDPDKLEDYLKEEFEDLYLELGEEFKNIDPEIEEKLQDEYTWNKPWMKDDLMFSMEFVDRYEERQGMLRETYYEEISNLPPYYEKYKEDHNLKIYNSVLKEVFKNDFNFGIDNVDTIKPTGKIPEFQVVYLNNRKEIINASDEKIIQIWWELENEGLVYE